MKNILIGSIIGITSLIPGVSAGTIIYLSKDYNYINNLIINFKNNIKSILLLLLGLLISVLIFSKILEYLFMNYPYETKFFIVGLLLSSLKDTIKKQDKYNIIFIILGILTILFLSYITIDTPLVINTYPNITFLFLIIFLLCGLIDGILTITPGISGSMVMMILGPYYLYKSYLANVFNNFVFIIPLIFYFIGDIIGFFVGSKVSTYLLKKWKKQFESFIIGMVITSILLLIPYHFSFSSLFFLVIGYIIKK